MNSFKAIEKQAAISNNQYILALAISKRVRHLRSGAPTLSSVQNPGEHPIEATLDEFAENQISYSAQKNEDNTTKNEKHRRAF